MEVKPDGTTAKLWEIDCSKPQHAFSVAVGLGFSGKRKRVLLPTDQVSKDVGIA